MAKTATPNNAPFKTLEWTTDVDMGCFTSFKTGGKADYFLEPAGLEELAAAVGWARARGLEYLILGNGTNLLFRDGGFRGAVIHLGAGFSAIETQGTRIHAGAGASLAAVAAKAAEASLAGMEFASGIPGSIGGGAFMNAGAYDGELKDIIESVEVLNPVNGEISRLPVGELAYGYRRSRMMEEGWIVISVTLHLNPGDRDIILSRMKDLTDQRNRKQPMEWPSAGSFFKRPPGHYAGKLIQEAGLAGISVGGAQVSPKHCGFIVNAGGATAGDIQCLMRMVQATVLEESGILLEPEVRIVGEDL